MRRAIAFIDGKPEWKDVTWFEEHKDYEPYINKKEVDPQKPFEENYTKLVKRWGLKRAHHFAMPANYNPEEYDDETLRKYTSVDSFKLLWEDYIVDNIPEAVAEERISLLDNGRYQIADVMFNDTVVEIEGTSKNWTGDYEVRNDNYIKAGKNVIRIYSNSPKIDFFLANRPTHDKKVRVFFYDKEEGFMEVKGRDLEKGITKEELLEQIKTNDRTVSQTRQITYEQSNIKQNEWKQYENIYTGQNIIVGDKDIYIERDDGFNKYLDGAYNKEFSDVRNNIATYSWMPKQLNKNFADFIESETKTKSEQKTSELLKDIAKGKETIKSETYKEIQERYNKLEDYMKEYEGETNIVYSMEKRNVPLKQDELKITFYNMDSEEKAMYSSSKKSALSKARNAYFGYTIDEDEEMALIKTLPIDSDLYLNDLCEWMENAQSYLSRKCREQKVIENVPVQDIRIYENKDTIGLEIKALNNKIKIDNSSIKELLGKDLTQMTQEEKETFLLDFENYKKTFLFIDSLNNLHTNNLNNDKYLVDMINSMDDLTKAKYEIQIENYLYDNYHSNYKTEIEKLNTLLRAVPTEEEKNIAINQEQIENFIKKFPVIDLSDRKENMSQILRQLDIDLLPITEDKYCVVPSAIRKDIQYEIHQIINDKVENREHLMSKNTIELNYLVSTLNNRHLQVMEKEINANLSAMTYANNVCKLQNEDIQNNHFKEGIKQNMFHNINIGKQYPEEKVKNVNNEFNYWTFEKNGEKLMLYVSKDTADLAYETSKMFGHTVLEIPIPESQMSKAIGKNGKTVNAITNQINTRFYKGEKVINNISFYGVPDEDFEYKEPIAYISDEKIERWVNKAKENYYQNHISLKDIKNEENKYQVIGEFKTR